jgi:hypothetical protein
MSYKVRTKAASRSKASKASSTLHEYLAWHSSIVLAMQDEMSEADYMCSYAYVSPWRQTARHFDVEHGQASFDDYVMADRFDKALASLRQTIRPYAC